MCLSYIQGVLLLISGCTYTFTDKFSGCAFTSSSSSDEFHEELLLRPLPSGHLHAHFQFVTTWHVPVHNDKVVIVFVMRDGPLCQGYDRYVIVIVTSDSPK